MGKLLLILFGVIFFLIWISYQAGRHSSSRRKKEKWKQYQNQLFERDIDKLAEKIMKKKDFK